MTYAQAYCQLPKDAEWSSSFGNPGEGGYVEFYRCPNGNRYVIANGKYDAFEPFEWTCEKLEPTQRDKFELASSSLSALK